MPATLLLVLLALTAIVALVSTVSAVRAARELRKLKVGRADTTAELATAQRGLADERGRLGAVLDGMVEAVVVTGPDGRIALCNDAFRELAEGEIVGKLPLEALRSADFDQALRDAAAGDGAVAREVYLSHGGRTFVAHAAPVPRRAGQSAGAVCLLHDITELRRLEKVRRDFVANVSHELRTPVTALRGYAETLLDGALENPANARRFVEIIHRHAERLTRLVSDLLTLSAAEAPRTAVPTEPVPLAPIIASTLKLLAPQLTARKLKVENLVTDQQGLGDPDWVEQVIINLCENAAKYTPEGGTIRISADSAGARTRLIVFNTGPGIEVHHMTRVFERFYRIDAGRSRTEGGTGLGLSIVKHLVEAMNGEVGVSSEPGKGVRFWFDLAAPPAPAPSPAVAESPENPQPSKS